MSLCAGNTSPSLPTIIRTSLNSAKKANISNKGEGGKQQKQQAKAQSIPGLSASLPMQVPMSILKTTEKEG